MLHVEAEHYEANPDSIVGFDMEGKLVFLLYIGYPMHRSGTCKLSKIGDESVIGSSDDHKMSSDYLHISLIVIQQR